MIRQVSKDETIFVIYLFYKTAMLYVHTYILSTNSNIIHHNSLIYNELIVSHCKSTIKIRITMVIIHNTLKDCCTVQCKAYILEVFSCILISTNRLSWRENRFKTNPSIWLFTYTFIIKLYTSWTAMFGLFTLCITFQIWIYLPNYQSKTAPDITLVRKHTATFAISSCTVVYWIQSDNMWICRYDDLI